MKSDQENVAELIRLLSVNSEEIKKKIIEGDINASSILIGKRVEIVESLREFADAKVSFTNSDIRSELETTMAKIGKDVSESVGMINARLAGLLKELAKTRGAKGIATYAAMSVQPGAGQDPGSRNRF